MDWIQEEKTLLNMKKIITLVWRMDSRQLHPYYIRLQQNQAKILPGRIGDAFIKNLAQLSSGEISLEKEAWTDLMRDTDRLLYLIHKYQNLDEDAWRTALPKLKILLHQNFRTGLSIAFGLALEEKIDGKRELEEIAAWLMEDTSQRNKIIKNKKRFLISGQIKKIAIPALACLSACFMFVWLYGQVQRNQNNWDLQQMKAQASQESDSVSMGYSEKKAGAEQNLKKIQISDVQQRKFRPKKLAQYRKMSEKYPQLYGWLQIQNTQIDLPVMRAKKDREFYLYHDFTGEESAEGALFVDAENHLYPRDDNIVIYGHNMKNGHIFGTLGMYANKDFFQAHRVIQFDTLYEAGTYEAVAVLKTRILNENEQGFRYYQFFQYDNKKEFQECQEFVEDNRMFETDNALRYGDKILMLSTCEYSQENGRLVVVARKNE